MKSRFWIRNLVFYGLAAFMVVTSIVSLVSGIKWLNKPFPGFLVYPTPYVGSFSTRDWPGKQAGLAYLDRIISVDGQPVRSGQEVLDAARSKKPGTQINYVVESKGQRREFTVPVTIFTFKDFFYVFSPTFIIGITMYILGIIVYLLKPNTYTSWVFLIMCLTLGIYGITGFECQSTHAFIGLNTYALSIFPFCFFHLGLIFPEKKRILTRLPVLNYLIYLPGLILLICYKIYFLLLAGASDLNVATWIPYWKVLSSIARLFTLFGFVSLIVLVLYSYFKSVTTQARTRAKMMIFGVAISFLPVGILMILALALKVYFPFNFIPVFVVFFPIFIAYSIVKHNLFDADVIIRRTVGYAVVTLVVIAAYVGVSVTLNVLLGQYQAVQSRAFPILFTLGIILIFNPLRDRIQALVDRIFFRKEYDSGEIVKKIGNAMTSLLDLSQILKKLAGTFIEDMFINTTSFMLLNPATAEYQVYLSEGENKRDIENAVLKRKDPLVAIFEKEKRELTKYDVLEDPKYRLVSEKCAENFDMLKASILVPLVYQEKVIGLFSLGEKKSGKFYNRQDIDLLHAVANQGAVAIENARLFQENLEKQRMEEELAIGRELQMSMLPAECPQIEGYEIAAYSEPAREVGGDFYDFIEISEKKLGIVIGDVTGKSVSGALVMSASRSIFRMLGENELTVRESMIRANRRTKKDIKTGMFVALLYAVLGVTDKSLTLCSAGQTLPVFRAAGSDETRLVETEGDSFPLGILEDATYEDTRLQLETGDKVVLYTDGIVEAMNEQEELFGFDRLLEVIRKSPAETAEALLKEIKDNVNEFAGAALQHDDITIIVIQAT